MYVRHSMLMGLYSFVCEIIIQVIYYLSSYIECRIVQQKQQIT